MRINSDFQRFGLGILLAVFTMAVQAQQDPVDRSIITLSASYGYYDFAKERGVDNREFGGVALGLQFSRTFSMALFYTRSHIDNDGADKRRFENFYVEGAWYFNTESNLRPYIVGGLGETLEGEGKIADDTSVNGGVGIQWVVAPKWALKADWRYFHSLDESYADTSLMTTLTYRFGEGERF